MAVDAKLPVIKPGIKLVALDVDGVLTDGMLTYSTTGAEHKRFNVKDGLGLSLVSGAGVPIAIITARSSVIVERRAAELGIAHVFQDCKNKLPELQRLCDQLGVTLAETAYMGDDLPDLPVLKAVGFSACPADAALVVRETCRWVSGYNGGQGAVRELLETLFPQLFADKISQLLSVQPVSLKQ